MVVVFVFKGPIAYGIFLGGVFGGVGVVMLCVFVLSLLCSAVENRRSISEEPYPDVEGADPIVPIPSPESAQSRQSGNASSIPTCPPIQLSTFDVSTTTPPSSSGLPLIQTSPTSGAMSEGPGAEPAHLVQQPGSDAVGFLQYEDSVSIRVPPTVYIAA